MYCKTCGTQLGDPEEDLHDPEGLSDVAQELDIQPENEDAHLVVKDGSRGWRYFCSELGQITSIVPEPPDGGSDKGDREGEGGEPKREKRQQPEAEPETVYDLPEEKNPMQVLADVVTKPFIGLNQEQIDEVRDWAQDYGGQLPPDILQDILENMSGVQKQTAALARQKYEVKLNKWIQEQQTDRDGPPIGVSAQPPARRRRRSRGGGTASGGGGSPEQPEPQPSEPSGSDPIPRGDLATYRRGRRTRRRNDALDVATEEAARQIAQEASGEIAREFSRYFGIPAKILEAKAERDPDWFFEKLEQWDIDLDAFLEPSESRKRELEERRRGPAVDREADEALRRTQERTEAEPPPEGDELERNLFDDEEEEVTEEEQPEAPEGLFDDEEIPAQRGD